MSVSYASVGAALAALRSRFRPNNGELSAAVQMSYTTYLKVERDQRELSFLMALRLCRFYGLDIHEFIALMGEAALGRPEIVIQRQRDRLARLKAEKEAKVVEMKNKRSGGK